MNCPKCNNQVEDMSNGMCNNCKSEQDQVNEILVKAYIGEGADKIYSKMYVNLSSVWWPFFLGPYYFIYRKMYLIAFFAFALSYAFSFSNIAFRVPLYLVYPFLHHDCTSGTLTERLRISY